MSLSRGAANYILEHATGVSAEGYWNDIACPVRYILWNSPLEVGETYHKVIFDPVTMILHNGNVRKILPYLPPSKLKRMDKDWVAEYHLAEQDEDVMTTSNKRRMKLVDQLALRWP